MESKFKNIARLGLDVIELRRTREHNDNGALCFWVDDIPIKAVRAEELERVLENAPRVTASWEQGAITHVWRTNYKPQPNAKHEALLLGVEPIKRDTAESLLKELVNAFSTSCSKFHPGGEFIERAKRVVGK